MTHQIYICPQCGCPDLEAEKALIVVAAKDRKVSCPNCKWEGALSDAAGVLSSEKVYDTKAVLNLLLFITSKYAAGPLAQGLVYIGLLEQGDQEGLDKVMRAAVAGLIQEAFLAAAAHAAEKEKLKDKEAGDAPGEA